MDYRWGAYLGGSWHSKGSLTLLEEIEKKIILSLPCKDTETEKNGTHQKPWSPTFQPLNLWRKTVSYLSPLVYGIPCIAILLFVNPQRALKSFHWYLPGSVWMSPMRRKTILFLTRSCRHTFSALWCWHKYIVFEEFLLLVETRHKAPWMAPPLHPSPFSLLFYLL